MDAKTKRKNWRINYVKTIRGRALKLINNARARGETKNISVDLPLEWVEARLTENKCEITGMPFDLTAPQGTTRRWNAPSLDRINKNLPYEPKNTRVVLWAVNCALSEYGTEVMLPILKAMVQGIENAKKNTTTSVSTGIDQQGEIYPELGSFSATGIGEDDDNAHHHCGTISGEDLDHRAQTSSGNGVGTGNQEVVPLETFTRIENHREPDAEIVRLEFGSRHLSD